MDTSERRIFQAEVQWVSEDELGAWLTGQETGKYHWDRLNDCSGSKI